MGPLFVTGVSGYVGRHLLDLIETGQFEAVYCLVRESSTLPKRPRLEIVRGDLLDADSYLNALTHCESVLHLAAMTGKARPADYFRVNLEGTRALLDGCRRAGIRRFLYVSTIAAKFRDQSYYYYAQSKRQAETAVQASGTPYTIVRPTMIFGPEAPVLLSLTKLAKAPFIPVLGSGRTPVQPLFVDDLARCLLSILRGTFENNVIELGGPQVIGIGELLRRVRRARGWGEGRTINLPAGIAISTLAFLEKLFFGLWPVTAGQLASFANDGTASVNQRLLEWQAGMKGIDDMLRLSYHADG